jgi:VWFA-related protein
MGFAALGADRSRPDFRVDSNLVLIPITVTDPANHAVVGLPREAFRVFEGKVEQSLVQFASQDAPVSVGVVFDSSGSMQDKIAAARAAVARFLDIANPEDEFFLVDFNSTAQVSIPFTSEAADIRNQLLFTGANGRTALLDAVSLAINSMRNARYARRALLIISDGIDNDSRYTEFEILRRVRESDLSVYALAIDARGSIMLPEENRGDALLADLARESGGRYFAVRNPSELPGIAARIGLELRNQYVIGYQPSSLARDGSYHRVQVKLARRDLHATWKPGYVDQR